MRFDRIALAALLCGVPAAFTEPAAATDAPVADTSRIVSIGGAVTEILYDLGLEDRIVGIDTTSLYPPAAAKSKASVGYMRQLSPEGVLSLRPSLVLAIAGAGPKEAMDVLAGAHVPLVVIPDSYSADGIVAKIRDVARATGREARGACLVERVNADFDALKALRARIDVPKRVMFVLSFVDGRGMVAGVRTAADGIIRLAGAQNAVTEFDGYKQIGDEAVITAKPDVILGMERGGPGTLTAASVFAVPAFSATPAAAQRRFVTMDGLYLLGFGPRTARAARDLAVQIYPGLTAQSFPTEQGLGGDSQPCRE